MLFSGFLPKGLQRLDCQLLNCLFAAANKKNKLFYIQTQLLLFLIALGLKVTTLHMHAPLGATMHAPRSNHTHPSSNHACPPEQPCMPSWSNHVPPRTTMHPQATMHAPQEQPHTPPSDQPHMPPQINHTSPKEQPCMPPKATMHALQATMHTPQSNHACVIG